MVRSSSSPCQTTKSGNCRSYERLMHKSFRRSRTSLALGEEWSLGIHRHRTFGPGHRSVRCLSMELLRSYQRWCYSERQSRISLVPVRERSTDVDRHHFYSGQVRHRSIVDAWNFCDPNNDGASVCSTMIGDELNELHKAVLGKPA